MDKISWNILDSLSDDWESLKQIYPLIDFPELSVNKVVVKIKELFENGLIQNMSNIKFDEDRIILDYKENNGTKFWFGLTELGAKEWEKYSEKYSGEKIDWENCYSLSYGNGKGFIEGANREVCENILEIEIIKKRIKVIDNSISYSTVAEIKLKYYKKIFNGLRLEFKYLQT